MAGLVLRDAGDRHQREIETDSREIETDSNTERDGSSKEGSSKERQEGSVSSFLHP